MRPPGKRRLPSLPQRNPPKRILRRRNPPLPPKKRIPLPRRKRAPAEDGEQNHIHAANREDSCEEPSFAPLTVTGGKLESGCYYLTDDLALEEPLCVPKNGAQVTLCLNGHTLRLADGAEGCIIFVAVSDKDAEPSVLTITDCNESGQLQQLLRRRRRRACL